MGSSTKIYGIDTKGGVGAKPFNQHGLNDFPICFVPIDQPQTLYPEVIQGHSRKTYHFINIGELLQQF